MTTQLDPSDAPLFSCSAVIVVSTAQLAALRDLGLGMPLISSVLDGVEPRPDLLREQDTITETGELSDWFGFIWKTLVQPPSSVLVTRTDGASTWLWTYAIGEDGFVEQSLADAGCMWAIGSHEQLLGRTLLCTGAIRSSTSEQARELDPLSLLPAWSGSVHIGGAQGSRRLDYSYDGTSWSVDNATRSASQFVAAIAELYAPGVSDPTEAS
jgi:hypothetical protein